MKDRGVGCLNKTKSKHDIERALSLSLSLCVCVWAKKKKQRGLKATLFVVTDFCRSPTANNHLYPGSEGHPCHVQKHTSWPRSDLCSFNINKNV